MKSKGTLILMGFQITTKGTNHIRDEATVKIQISK